MRLLAPLPPPLRGGSLDGAPFASDGAETAPMTAANREAPQLQRRLC